jgi:TatD DNase family protein
LGLYISFSGIITFKNAKNLQEIAKQVPLDRCIIETDSPYLAPMPYRGKRNEPSYLKEIAIFLANLKDLGFEEISSITTGNFFQLFDKAKRN